MLKEEQYNKCLLKSWNPTSKRIYALQPFFVSTKEADQKSHDFFMELSKNRRNICKVKHLNEINLFIESIFTDLDRNIKSTQSKLIQLINLQNNIIKNVSDRKNLTDFMLFTTNSKILKLETENSLLIDSINHLRKDIYDLDNSKKVQNKVKNMLQNENANYKCKISKTKLEQLKINKLHMQINQKYDMQEANFNQTSENNEKNSFSLQRLKDSISYYNEKIINIKDEISNFENEYFIKKRVSIVLLKDSVVSKNNTIVHSNNNQEMQFNQKISNIISKINLLRNSNCDIESEMAKTHSEFIYSMKNNIDLDNKKEELISINQFQFEIVENWKNDQYIKEKEIENLHILIDKVKKENETLCRLSEKKEKYIFDYQILKNEKMEQYDQYIAYLANDIENIENKIRLINQLK